MHTYIHTYIHDCTHVQLAVRQRYIPESKVLAKAVDVDKEVGIDVCVCVCVFVCVVWICMLLTWVCARYRHR